MACAFMIPTPHQFVFTDKCPKQLNNVLHKVKPAALMMHLITKQAINTSSNNKLHKKNKFSF